MMDWEWDEDSTAQNILDLTENIPEKPIFKKNYNVQTTIIAIQTGLVCLHD